MRRLTVAVLLSAIFLPSMVGADPVLRFTLQGGGIINDAWSTVLQFDVNPATIELTRSDNSQFAHFELLRWTTPTSFGEEFAAQFQSPDTERTSQVTSSFELAPGAQWTDPDPLGAMRFNLTTTERIGDSTISRRLYWNVYPQYLFRFSEFDPVLHLFPLGGHILEEAHLAGTGPVPYHWGGFSVASVTPVPEPSTLVFVGTGALWLIRRRFWRH